MGCVAWVCTGALGCVDPSAPPPGGGAHEPSTTDERNEHAAAVPALAGPAFAPLHVLPETLLKAGPQYLYLRGTPTIIDTTALTIDGVANPYFMRQGNYAVLLTTTLTVASPVTLTGTSPLIIVAEEQVVISALIDASAIGRAPGPGASTSGAGAGGAGQSVLLAQRASSGGGGAGYGTVGAAGGTNNSTSYPAGAGGPTYGMGPADTLVGGARGGHGGFSLGSVGAPGTGGAGGGALQISSALSIEIDAAGHLKASGGGGAGGYGGFVGGGGGGSGGELLLEAPQLTIAGKLTANGGGGGGGGAGCGGCSTIGADGTDGLGSASPAAGGTGGIPQGSAGGAGASIPPFASARPGTGMNSKGGGGGGGAGRIWLRFNAATPPIIMSATISPPHGTDSSLP